MQMTVTAKIQLVVSAENCELLDSTANAYRNACNFVSEYIFRTHNLKQFSLNKELYYEIREKFGLGSQMTQSVLKNCNFPIQNDSDKSARMDSAEV